MNIERVGTARYQVGEGPVWDPAEQALYFVDLLAKAVWRYDEAAATFRSWSMPSMIGCLAVREQGGLVVALEDGLHRLDTATGELQRFNDLLGSLTETQPNDGKVDPRGRLIVGTQPKSLADMRPLGRLFCVHPDGRTEPLDEGFKIANGPAWSLDGGTFYFSNSITKTLFAYDYDLDTGRVANRRVFADTSALGGMPDGATVDTEGRLWVAICGGGKVAAYRPDGTLERTVDLPVPLVGSVMFGGPNLDRLYVTTLDARLLGMPDHPLGGALFVIDGLEAQGRPEHRFAG